MSSTVIEELVQANRILANEGVLDGFGHISCRDPERADRYFMSRSRAPALVGAEDIIHFDLDNVPLDPAEKRGLYYERYIHGEVYKLRPDVQAVVHSHSPTVVPFSVTRFKLRPILHNAAFLGAGAPVFEIKHEFGVTDLMISTPAMGAALARTLGGDSVALLRGHGNVVVAPSLKLAVWRAYYTEINARMLAQARLLGDDEIEYMSLEETEVTDRVMRGAVERPWELWARKAAAGPARSEIG